MTYWLDPVCSHSPVFLTRRDNHMAVVNSVAGVRYFPPWLARPSLPP